MKYHLSSFFPPLLGILWLQPPLEKLLNESPVYTIHVVLNASVSGSHFQKVVRNWMWAYSEKAWMYLPGFSATSSSCLWWDSDIVWHLNPFCGERRGEGRERSKKKKGRGVRERSGRKGGLEKRSNEKWDSWELCIKSSKLFHTCG